MELFHLEGWPQDVDMEVGRARAEQTTQQLLALLGVSQNVEKN